MATILVVEDDNLSQRLLAKILASGGHAAVTTDAVQQAWEILEKPTFPDLVILDNQLAKGWGWELLQRIRTDLVFQHLPVVVYTAHTERSSILKYVEFGVQGMLVKPYRAEVILGEVKKALAADWMSRLIEAPDAAAKRLAVAPSDYVSMVTAAATGLTESMQEIREAVKNRALDPRIDRTINRISSEGTALGMPLLRSTAELLEKAVNNRNSPEIQARLRQLESLQRVLKHRAHLYIGFQEVVPPVAQLERVALPSSSHTPSLTASPIGSFCRRTTAAPLWAFGPQVAAAGPARDAGVEGWLEWSTGEARPPVVAAMLETFKALGGLSYTTVEALASEITALPGYEPVFLRLATRLSSLDDETTALDVPLAIHRLGVYRSGVLLACARVAIVPKGESPLDLNPLLVHTLASLLLGYELAHGLKLSEENLCASAGLARDLGFWLLALHDPLRFGLSLARALTHGGSIVEAEREVFGFSHEEAGAGFLDRHLSLPLLEQAAGNRGLGGELRNEQVPALAAAALADLLAWCAAADVEEEGAALRATLARPDHPVWRALARAGVELPMEIPELVDTMRDIAKSAYWSIAVIVQWASQDPKSKTAHPKVSR